MTSRPHKASSRAAWYRENGEHTEDTVVWQYSEFALRLVRADI
jgi:hypothetical protein